MSPAAAARRPPLPAEPPRRRSGLAWSLAALAALLLAQGVRMNLAKSREQLSARLLAKVAKGDKDGQILNTLGLAGDAAGRFAHLDALGAQWRLQLFDRGGALLAQRRGSLPAGVQPVGLAMGPEGSAWLGFSDGGLLRFDAALKPRGGSRLEGPLASLVSDGEGGAWALDRERGRVLRLGPGGDLLAAPDFLGRGPGKLGPATAVAAGSGGVLAALYPAGRRQLARVFGAPGGPASFLVEVPPSPIHILALAEGRLYFNDNEVGKGLTVLRLDGRLLGRITHLGEEDLLGLQGYVAGNPYNGDLYVNYPPSLAVLRPGWEER